MAGGPGTAKAVRPERNLDDLYTPTLSDVPAQAVDAPRPWRLASQFYVAFFGGPLAAAAVGYLNGKRLGLARDRLLAIVGIGVAALAVTVAAVAFGRGSGGATRLVSQASGVVAFLAIRELTKSADHRYAIRVRGDDAYAPLWRPGIAIVLVCGIVTGLVFVAVLAP